MSKINARQVINRLLAERYDVVHLEREKDNHRHTQSVTMVVRAAGTPTYAVRSVFTPGWDGALEPLYDSSGEEFSLAEATIFSDPTVGEGTFDIPRRVQRELRLYHRDATCFTVQKLVRATTQGLIEQLGPLEEWDWFDRDEISHSLPDWSQLSGRSRPLDDLPAELQLELKEVLVDILYMTLGQPKRSAVVQQERQEEEDWFAHFEPSI